jgi:hypothetical protein
MKAGIFTAVVFAFTGLRASGSDLPQAAEKIVQQFESDQIAARKRVMAELEAVKNVELRRGNSVGVNAIEAKIKELNATNAAAQAASAPGTQTGVANVPAAAGAITPTTPGTPAKIEIKANAKYGVQLGPVHPGGHITLQYADGRWAMSSAEPDPNKWVIPDESNYPGNSLGIYSLENGEAKLLTAVPNGTKHKPFHFHFLKEYADIMLRIQDGDPSDNQGSAIYTVTLNP